MSEPDFMRRLPPVEAGAARAGAPTTSMTPELLASLLTDGDDELAAWVLRSALEERPRAVVYDTLVRDAMRLIGERWAEGRWSVAEEHLASRTLLRTLERLRPEQGPAGRVGPLAVLCGVAGEHHVIGLVCLEHVLIVAGWTVSNLGADVPAPDLARFVSRHEARLVALTASLPDRAAAVMEAVGAIRAARSDASGTRIMLGGAFAADPAAVGAVGLDWSGTSLSEASAFAARLADRLGPEVSDPS